jgi:hypothetical protein
LNAGIEQAFIVKKCKMLVEKAIVEATGSSISGHERNNTQQKGGQLNGTEPIRKDA